MASRRERISCSAAGSGSQTRTLLSVLVLALPRNEPERLGERELESPRGGADLSDGFTQRRRQPSGLAVGEGQRAVRRRARAARPGRACTDRTSSDSRSTASAMMSLQSPMHSSQMKTFGPAISFLTSCWVFPQNEQLRLAHRCSDIRSPRTALAGRHRPVPHTATLACSAPGAGRTPGPERGTAPVGDHRRRPEPSADGSSRTRASVASAVIASSIA